MRPLGPAGPNGVSRQPLESIGKNPVSLKVLEGPRNNGLAGEVPEVEFMCSLALASTAFRRISRSSCSGSTVGQSVTKVVIVSTVSNKLSCRFRCLRAIGVFALGSP